MKKLNLINILSRFFFLIPFCFILSCSKLAEKNVRVDVKAPNLSQGYTVETVQKIKQQNFSAMDVSAMGAVAPTTINQINCYAVMVSGPDSSLQRSSCPLTDTMGNTVSPTATVQGPLKFGILKGLVKAGETISLEVSPGRDRVFTLLGFYADPITVCADLNSTASEVDGDAISDPYLIGQSVPTLLNSGQTTTVFIQLPASGTSFTTASTIISKDGCAGPDVPNGGSTTATQMVFQKNQFPAYNFNENSCNSFDIIFKDTNGRQARAGFPFDLNIFTSIYANVGGSGSVLINSGTALTMYADSSCSGTTLPSIAVSSSDDRKTVYFMTSSVSAAAEYKFSILDSNNQLDSPNLTIGTLPSIESPKIMNLPFSTDVLRITGPRRVLSGQCYNYKVDVRKTFSGPGGPEELYYFAKAKDITTRVYENIGCIDSSVLNLNQLSTATNSRNTPFNVSIKSSATAPSSQFYTLKLATTSAGVQVSGTETVNTQFDVNVVGGTTNPTFIGLDMYNTFPLLNNECNGPFYLSIENEKRAAINLSSIDITATASGATGVFLYNESDESCIGTPTSTLNYSASNDSGIVFYLKSYQSSATSATINFEADLNGGSLILKKQQTIFFQ